MVIAAVSVELMPKLIHASEGWENTLAICIGFIIGVVAMLLLKVQSTVHIIVGAFSKSKLYAGLVGRRTRR